MPRIHLEVDTGMTRGGVRNDWAEFVAEIAKAVKDNGVEVVGLWSHFARADEPDQSFNQQQLDTFHKRLAILISQGINPQFVHIANSAAALTNKDSYKSICALSPYSIGGPERTRLNHYCCGKPQMQGVLGAKPTMT